MQRVYLDNVSNLLATLSTSFLRSKKAAQFSLSRKKKVVENIPPKIITPLLIPSLQLINQSYLGSLFQ